MPSENHVDAYAMRIDRREVVLRTVVVKRDLELMHAPGQLLIEFMQTLQVCACAFA